MLRSKFCSRVAVGRHVHSSLGFVPGHGSAAARRNRHRTPAVVTPQSSTGRPPRSFRSARTGDRGKRTVRLHGLETKPCAPPGTTAEPSGSAGPDTTPVAGSRPRCAVSRPSANASLQGTQTAKPPKSRSASPSSTASTHSAPPRSSAWPDINGKRGSHASSVSCATTPRRGLLQRNRNRSAGAGSSLTHPENCPIFGE